MKPEICRIPNENKWIFTLSCFCIIRKLYCCLISDNNFFEISFVEILYRLVSMSLSSKFNLHFWIRLKIRANSNVQRKKTRITTYMHIVAANIDESYYIINVNICMFWIICAGRDFLDWGRLFFVFSVSIVCGFVIVFVGQTEYTGNDIPLVALEKCQQLIRMTEISIYIRCKFDFFSAFFLLLVLVVIKSKAMCTNWFLSKSKNILSHQSQSHLMSRLFWLRVHRTHIQIKQQVFCF